MAKRVLPLINHKKNAQDKAVAAYLESIRVDFYPAFVGATKRGGDRAQDGKPWECDEWRVSFDRSGAIPLRESYYTGTGLRERNSAGELCPVFPTAASVLYSLLMDDHEGESFESWAGNFGYDTDSREAYRIWEECGRIGGELRAFFTVEQISHLRELLEDY